MQNKSEVRDEFHNMAVIVYGVDSATRLMDQYDDVMGEKAQTYALNGFPDMYYVIAPRGGGQWTWYFEDPIEGVEYGGTFFSREEAMMSASHDSDANVLVDDDLGARIRRAI